MRAIWRPLAIVCLVLLVPILPFVGFGGWMEVQLSIRLDPPPSPAMIALLTVGVLSSDILLPVPSSFVSTFAVVQLAVAAATAASWLGMTAGAIVGFRIASFWGWACCSLRLSTADDLERMDGVSRRWGAIVVITRPLPVLAEAAVLLVGMTDAGLAGRSSATTDAQQSGHRAGLFGARQALRLVTRQPPLALAVSIALPLLAATIARWWLR